MADQRRSQRDVSDARRLARQENVERAIAEGRLVVRQMTPQEREAGDARAAAATARIMANKRRYAS